VRATLETIQAGIDKLIQVVEKLSLNADAAASNEHEVRQENTELARQLDLVRLTTEAIAKNEEELARRLDSVCLNAEANAKSHRVLRQENTELRALAEGGFLRFATRVDADDFRAFAAIMLTGNRSQAAESLQIPQRTLYDRVDTWPSRGGDYKRMYRMIEWRKKVGRKIKVRLDDSLLGTEVDGQAENPETANDVLASMRDKSDEKSRDELLRDILQALVSQTAENWQCVRDELIEILQGEVPEYPVFR